MRCFLPSSDRAEIPLLRSRLWWLARKDVNELLSSRATWLLWLAAGPLVGHAFITAVRTYADVSGRAGGAAALAQGISPLDGLLVPTFGAYALIATLLLPFVAIRVVSAEKESGALGLLLQGHTSLSWMIVVKTTVLLYAWMVAWIPGVAALALWRSYGGHINGAELGAVLAGHFLRGLLVIAVAFVSAALTENAATAAVASLGVTLGTWALDFVAQVQGGWAATLARFTPDSALRTFEQGEWSAAVVAVTVITSATLLVVCTVSLASGLSMRRRVWQSSVAVGMACLLLAGAATMRRSVDVSEDRRNSFAPEDERALSALRGPIHVVARLAPEDPRLVDLERSVLHKLSRTVPVTVETSSEGSTGLFERPGEGYGEVWYEWNGQRRMTRSTTVPIVLETLYDLTGIPAPRDRRPASYAGYPLKAEPVGAAVVLYGLWPASVLLLALGRTRRRA